MSFWVGLSILLVGFVAINIVFAIHSLNPFFMPIIIGGALLVWAIKIFKDVEQ